MTDAIQKLGLPQPEYLKVDVDGIEHLILKAELSVLRGAKGVLVEINDGFAEQADRSREALAEAGMVMSQKRHSEMRGNSMAFPRVYNQIWTRP